MTARGALLHRSRRTPSPGTASPEAVANDLQRQLAAAAWILGWIGGPIPAIVMLLVTGREGWWARRHIAWAAVFWAVMWGVLFMLVAFTRDAGVFQALWISAVVFALVVTMIGAYSAAKASRSSIAREQSS